MLDAAGQFGTMLGQMLRGDPQKAARIAAEVRQRELLMQQAAEETAHQRQLAYTRLRGELKLGTFDGDNGGLVLKGVDVGQARGADSQATTPGNELGLKLSDDDLKPRGTQAAANTGPAESPTPNTDPMVVDLRNYQRAAYLATQPSVSPEAIIAAAQGDTSLIAMPPANAPIIAGAGLQQFQEANNAYRQSHHDGEKAAEYFNRAQALREIAGRELGTMKADLERQLAATSDKATLDEKHQMMAQIFSLARAQHETWVTAKAELDAVHARESFDQAALLRMIRPQPSGARPTAAPITDAALPDPTTDRGRRVRSMLKLAQDLQWPQAEQDHLKEAFARLATDGDEHATGSRISAAWARIGARGAQEFAQEASHAGGPGLPGSGLQTEYSDCTIFAVATATGLPYGIVASRATTLIHQGRWRSAADRTRPQSVIEQEGLNGDEVIMLAESFGQAEVVASDKFAEVLHQGRPVLVDMYANGTDFGTGASNPEHQVVLTKAFPHDGETWYEMIDSNQGPTHRLYLSHKELQTLLVENGVAFHPDEETVPALLRLAETK